MAVEELVFFAVVPICALLTLESVRNVLAGAGARCPAWRGGRGADAGLPRAGDRRGGRASSPSSCAVFRTGLFRQPAYWVAMAIVFAFMVPVDGWLTKLSAPIVVYRDADTSGLRPVWDILAEEFVYAFALLTLVILVWDRAGREEARAASDPDAGVRRTSSRTCVVTAVLLVVGAFAAMEAVSAVAHRGVMHGPGHGLAPQPPRCPVPAASSATTCSRCASRPSAWPCSPWPPSGPVVGAAVGRASG